MNQTTSPQAETPFQPPLAAVWQHLDALFDKDGTNTFTKACDTLEAVSKALRVGTAMQPDILARLLDSAVIDIRKAQEHVGHAIIELGEATLYEGWVERDGCSAGA